jgi:hypothetical protein
MLQDVDAMVESLIHGVSDLIIAMTLNMNNAAQWNAPKQISAYSSILYLSLFEFVQNNLRTISSNQW